MAHPLSLPKVPRERLHCRTVTFDGFRREDGLFVGQWAAPFLLIGVYNKLVKVAGSDRVNR